MIFEHAKSSRGAYCFGYDCVGFSETTRLVEQTISDVATGPFARSSGSGCDACDLLHIMMR